MVVCYVVEGGNKQSFNIVVVLDGKIQVLDSFVLLYLNHNKWLSLDYRYCMAYQHLHVLIWLSPAK